MYIMYLRYKNIDTSVKVIEKNINRMWLGLAACQNGEMLKLALGKKDFLFTKNK